MKIKIFYVIKPDFSHYYFPVTGDDKTIIYYLKIEETLISKCFNFLEEVTTIPQDSVEFIIQPNDQQKTWLRNLARAVRLEQNIETQLWEFYKT